MDGSGSLFVHRDDAKIESFISEISNSQVQVIGPELIFRKIYNGIGYDIFEGHIIKTDPETRKIQ